MQSIQTTLSPVIKRDLRQPTQNPAHTAESAKKSESIQTSPRSATAIENAQRGQILSSPTNPLSALISTLSATARLLKPLLVLAVVTGQFGRAEGQNLINADKRQLGDSSVLLTEDCYKMGSTSDRINCLGGSVRAFQEYQFDIDSAQDAALLTSQTIQNATNLAVQQQLTDFETQFTSDISTLRSDIATNTGKITTAENRLNATEANVAAQTTKLHDFMNAQNEKNTLVGTQIGELRTLFTGFNSSNSQNPDISHLTRQFGNYSMALETFKTTQEATDTSIADLRYDFTTYQDTSAQQFATLTQTNTAILSDVATLHSSQADTDASVDSLQRNFTSYQGNAAQQFYELTQADIQQYRAIDEFKSAQAATDAKLTAQVTNQSVAFSEFKSTQTDTDHRQNLEIAALKDQIAKLSDSDSDEGIHFGGTHIDYATLAIGSITALSVGIIGALSWCLSSAKKDHKELAESTNILAAGLASASNPQLQQLREEVRGKATTLSALVGQRQNIQHQLNVSLNTRPTEAPAILRTVLDADTAIEAYLNIPIEDRTQKDTSKFTGNLAILSANNRENSPLELAIQSVRTDISGIQRIIAEAQSSVITVTGEKV
jgi:hypothetical protein